MLSLWTIPALPLVGAALCLFVHILRSRPGTKPGSDRWLGGAASSFVLLSFGSTLWFVWNSWPKAPTVSFVADWIQAGGVSIPIALRLDSLSATLCLVITGVGGLIHIYSIDYMKGDRGFARYFACLNLFAAAMLILVLADNLPLMFVGWEGVGLCSYLLIGFWYEKGIPAEAGQKAFVVNRVGDLGFLIGILYLYLSFGQLDFDAITRGALEGKIGPSVATVTSLLLFAGAIGKSAQIPLHVWLPDAMAGPTPVSALIHAATMVTAGVYLVCRLSALFAASGVALLVVAGVGAATALFAATMALVERDIKKVLAYSTISQLGLMFLGAGAGAFQAATFHLVTHAFFKALLFLAAGSVIHAMEGEQDLFKMGGLRKKLPLTHATFLVGALALAGCPPLSGFVSKDEILWNAARHDTSTFWVLWSAASITSLLTAFYSMRLYMLVFHGKGRFDPAVHPHESPFLMRGPLLLLAAASALGGAVNLPAAIFHGAGWLGEKTRTVFQEAWSLLARRPQQPLGEEKEILFIALSAAIALAGIGVAILFYRGPGWTGARTWKERLPGLFQLWSAHYRVDEAYQIAVVAPLRLASIAASVFDAFVIDGLVDLSGSAARAAGNAVRRFQTGRIQTYALWAGAGAVVFLALTWWR